MAPPAAWGSASGVGVDPGLGFIGAQELASEDGLEIVVEVLEQLGVLQAMALPEGRGAQHVACVKCRAQAPPRSRRPRDPAGRRARTPPRACRPPSPPGVPAGRDAHRARPPRGRGSRGCASRCSIRVNASVASGANFRGLFWRGAMCVPAARMWRFATARLCSSASVPSAVARNSAPRCSIHSGVSGATSASRPAPRANAAASSRTSCDSCPVGARLALPQSCRAGPRLGERGAGGATGRRGGRWPGACAARAAVRCAGRCRTRRAGAPVRTTCRLVCQDTTALVVVASGCWLQWAGSGESAASGSGAASRSNQRSRRERCAAVAAAGSTASSNLPMRKRSPTNRACSSPGSSCASFTHNGELLLTQRTRAAWPSAIHLCMLARHQAQRVGQHQAAIGRAADDETLGRQCERRRIGFGGAGSARYAQRDHGYRTQPRARHKSACTRRASMFGVS